MHGPAGLSPPPAAEPACPVPDPASRAPITTSVDLLTNRLRGRRQFNLQATSLAIKTDPIPTELDLTAGDGGLPREYHRRAPN
jgi:hypothetical protein